CRRAASSKGRTSSGSAPSRRDAWRHAFPCSVRSLSPFGEREQAEIAASSTLSIGVAAVAYHCVAVRGGGVFRPVHAPSPGARFFLGEGGQFDSARRAVGRAEGM